MNKLRTGPTAIRAYLLIPDVRLNSRYPMTVEVFLDPAEQLLIEKGIVTEDEMADNYRDRIHAGVLTHYSIPKHLPQMPDGEDCYCGNPTHGLHWHGWAPA